MLVTRLFINVATLSICFHRRTIREATLSISVPRLSISVARLSINVATLSISFLYCLLE